MHLHADISSIAYRFFCYQATPLPSEARQVRADALTITGWDHDVHANGYLKISHQLVLTTSLPLNIADITGPEVAAPDIVSGSKPRSSRYTRARRTRQSHLISQYPLRSIARFLCDNLVSWCPKPSQPQRITSGICDKDRHVTSEYLAKDQVCFSCPAKSCILISKRYGNANWLETQKHWKRNYIMEWGALYFFLSILAIAANVPETHGLRRRWCTNGFLASARPDVPWWESMCIDPNIFWQIARSTSDLMPL